MNGQLEVPFDKDRRRQSYELSQEHLMVNKVIVFNCFLIMRTAFCPLLKLSLCLTYQTSCKKITDGTTPLYFRLVENLVPNGMEWYMPWMKIN